ncbi:MAG: hypothetical protein QM790_14530 [Nibricoccus sp.]
MKPLAVALAASLVANAFLAAAFFFKPAAATGWSWGSVKTHGTTGGSSITSASSRSSDTSGTQLAETIASRNPAALRDQLRALGLSDEVIRRTIRAVMMERYNDRYRALVALHQGDKSELLRTGGLSNGFTKEERAELRALSREINQQLVALLGPPSAESEIDNARYSFLPQEKVDQLRLINRDYAEMRNDLSDEIGRFRVASDDEKLRMLEQERRKDIESLLSPAELAEYDLRHSPTASMLRYRLANVNITDDEFRSLYNILKPTNNISLSALGIKPGVELTPEQRQQLTSLREAQVAAEEQAKTILGEDRYADFKRASDSDYRNLQSAASRFSLPQQAIEQVYGLRNSVSAQSQQIANNTSLDTAAKKAAMAKLADQTRTQVKTALGDEVGEAYLKTSMQWLDRVSKGYAVSFSASGNSTSFKSVNPHKPNTVVVTPKK